MKKIMDGNEACAYSAYNFTEVAGIYPITPASPMSEVTDKWAGEGKKNFFDMPVKIVEMQSEAGAIGMVHGSLLAGCLSSTYTSSQGLLLMIPNMYKIAGEGLPCVINVAARSLSTHALSIFGDHQDIYAVRSTGFAMMAMSSPQQCMDLTNVSYLSAIKGRVPFVNFFDGFRTSHELSKIDVIDSNEVKSLIDQKALKEFRDEAMNPDKPYTRGTAQNEDIYFQITEARNKYYDKLPDIVADYMKEINLIAGTKYAPFNYYGSPRATKLIVAMGSVCETIKEVVKHLNKKKNEYGLVEVHLYRPFSTKYFLKAIPKTVKKIAVLDRTKEAGSSGEPLYLDVVKTIKDIESKVLVVGGRYGLSSKNTTPAMIKGVFDFLDSKDVHSNFTVGIEDDVTNLSIKYDPSFVLPNNHTDFLIYGYGSDGMVSASKDILKITGNHSNAYVQGYFRYDSKKSGGITISNLRFAKDRITSPYYIEEAKMVVCTKDAYLGKLSMLENIKKDGIFLLNTDEDEMTVLDKMSVKDKKILQDKNIKFYIVNASKIAFDNGLRGKISAIMEVLIFKLGKVIDFDFACKKIKDSINVRFSHKGNDIAKKNIEAIDEAVNALKRVKVPNVTFDEIVEEKKDMFDLIGAMEGDVLPVSSFITNAHGAHDAATSRFDKRKISNIVPKYCSENCSTCGLCSLVCPHAVIRPYLLDEKEVEEAPESLKGKLIDANIKGSNLKFTIGISIDDCTGCGLCAGICPGLKDKKALRMTDKNKLKEEVEENEYLINEVSEKKDVLNRFTIKGSQLVEPKFEFSGACSGCGETPYIKLLTQLFGDNMIIANATGCSSIYGASTPSMPYSVPWANSLFEDNAEFGYGMKYADEAMKDRIKKVISENLSKVKKEEEKIYKDYLENISSDTADKLLEIVDKSKISELKKLKDFIKPKSVWMIGGDGWAYDIGFSGIDHVLSNKENVNILVLDTECYSNTGGQQSKSTREGAVVKFASTGKETPKKDLAAIALTYPNAYVGTISLGANPMQAINTMKEAENYNGPSIIIAYAPCIAHGILKGIQDSINTEKKATESGYFPLFRYNPETDEFKIDSKADFSKYYEFIASEDRYRSLKKLNKNYREMLEDNKNNAEKRFDHLEDILNNKKEEK
ncbi:MAG: pyruvate:ferredoxin (flavodoxin) oxidoreductase [Bacilli bacterium]|nr:pyruvate:ferredoxin (flavodoxin) oxidoreductase [Bacilli bacterium]